MSIGGSFVELGRLPMGTRINVNFGLPVLAERLSLDAIVQWSTEEGVGVQFEGLRAWEVWVLWRYLESLVPPPLELGPDAVDAAAPPALPPMPEAPEAPEAPEVPARPVEDPVAAPAQAASWWKQLHGVRAILTAHVEDGRLKLDAPTDLPEGKRVAVVVFEDEEPHGRR